MTKIKIFTFLTIVFTLHFNANAIKTGNKTIAVTCVSSYYDKIANKMADSLDTEVDKLICEELKKNRQFNRVINSQDVKKAKLNKQRIYTDQSLFVLLSYHNDSIDIMLRLSDLKTNMLREYNETLPKDRNLVIKTKINLLIDQIINICPGKDRIALYLRGVDGKYLSGKALVQLARRNIIKRFSLAYSSQNDNYNKIDMDTFSKKMLEAVGSQIKTEIINNDDVLASVCFETSIPVSIANKSKKGPPPKKDTRKPIKDCGGKPSLALGAPKDEESRKYRSTNIMRCLMMNLAPIRELYTKRISSVESFVGMIYVHMELDDDGNVKIADFYKYSVPDSVTVNETKKILMNMKCEMKFKDKGGKKSRFILVFSRGRDCEEY